MIKSLTSLRGIFIIFIFFHHCLNLYPGGGTMAVAFFFVLGGFSMTLGYMKKIDNVDFNYRHYIIRRSLKLFPLHWLCLIVAVFLAFFTHRLGLQQLSVLAFNALLLHTWLPVEKVYFSFNAVSWYLADTMFFAAVFPFLLRWIINASKIGKLLIAVSFALMYTLVAVILPVEWRHAILYISPYMRLTDFVFGIFLSLGYLKLKEQVVDRKQGVVFQITIIAAIALLVVESCLVSESISFIAPIYWPLVSIVIVFASLSGTAGGGIFYWKTNGCSGLAN